MKLPLALKEMLRCGFLKFIDNRIFSIFQIFFFRFQTKLDKRLSGVQKAANALTLNKDKMPASRITALEKIIKEYYEVEVVSLEILEMARNLEINVPNADYVPHGLKVVRYFEKQPGGLLALERLWREHFLHKMQPRHLPALWSVEHNRKPEEKWGNNLNEGT